MQDFSEKMFAIYCFWVIIIIFLKGDALIILQEGISPSYLKFQEKAIYYHGTAIAYF